VAQNATVSSLQFQEMYSANFRSQGQSHEANDVANDALQELERIGTSGLQILARGGKTG
jgi:hypothetical protein